MTAVRHEWWGELRHGGMLVAPQLLDELLPELPSLDERAYDRLRAAWLKLDAALHGGGAIDEARRAFAGELLEGFLGLAGWQKASSVGDQFKATAVTGEHLRPNWVLPTPEDDGALLAVSFDSSEIVGRGRGVRAHARLVELLRATGVPLGLLTNGRQFRLVHAGPDYDAWAEWDAQTWFDESEGRDTLRGLAALARAEAEAPESRLLRLIEAIRESRNRQGDLAQVLGEQVRQGVELLVREVDHVLDRDTALRDALWTDPANGHRLSDDEALGAIYQAATRLVMRLVLVLYAEARDLLPAHIEAYHDSYGIGSLYDTLARADREGRDAMAEHQSAWPRIIGLCRLIYLGSGHADLPVRAYGGQLFRPGYAQAPEPVLRALAALEAARPSDATAYRLLRLLKVGKFKVRAGRGARWVAGAVDFADLRTEYVGIVYEGLLDYELRRAAADDPVVLLNVGREPALPLSRLRELSAAEIKELLKKFKKEAAAAAGAEEGDEEAVDEEGDEPEEAEELEDEDQFEEEPTVDEAAEAAEEDAREAALAWAREAVEAAGLVRRPRGSKPDLAAFERRVHERASKLVAGVIPPGRLYLVASGGLRKGSGSFYTRPALSVPLAQRALEPLCYEREGDRLVPRPPEEIIALKVCEPAMGSGSFLVAALRYLVEALHRSLEHHGRIQPKAAREVVVTLPLGAPATGEETEELLPLAPEDERFPQMLRSRLARHVVERCLYGVDRNPMAVELARLALWVETLDRDLPFEYLDHKLKVGNSLVGCWLHLVEDYPIRALDREDSDGRSGERTKWLKKALADAKTQLPAVIDRMGGATRLFGELDEPVADLVAQVRDRFEALHELPRDERENAYRELLTSDEYVRLRQRMDTWCALWFWPAGEVEVPMPETWHNLSSDALSTIQQLTFDHRFFHWEIEFPDAFTSHRSGFDVVLGNPPWETLQPERAEFFSRLDPLYRGYTKSDAESAEEALFAADSGLEQHWLEYLGRIRALAHVAKAGGHPFEASLGASKRAKARLAAWADERQKRWGPARPEQPYRLQGSGKVYTYKLFLEAGLHLLRTNGRLGMVVPSGVYTDHGATEIRKTLLSDCTWEWAYFFENREQLFPIHSSYKFGPVLLQRDGATAALNAAFMRTDVTEWDRPEKYSVEVPVDDIRRFAPATWSLMEFRREHDLALVDRLYADHALLGDVTQDGDGRYSQEFNMSTDHRRFVPRRRLEALGLLGADDDTRDPRVRASLRVAGYVPLFEGKSIWLHNPLFLGARASESVSYFMPVATVREMEKPQRRKRTPKVTPGAWEEPRVAFRTVASSTNQRTLIAALIPSGVHGHSLASLDRVGSPYQAAALLGSLVVDYVLRMKVAVNISWFFAGTLPWPAVPSAHGFRSAVPELARSLNCVGADAGNHWEDALVDGTERMAARLLIDAWVCDAFGLKSDDVQYIAEQFPIYEKDLPAQHRYPRLAARVFTAFETAGPAEATAQARRLLAARQEDGCGFGLDELWQPDGGWERANREAREILEEAEAA